VAVALLGVASAAQAGSVLTIDLNNFTVNASGAPGIRTLNLSDNANTVIANIAVDGVSAAGSQPITDFTGQMFVDTSIAQNVSGAIAGNFILTDQFLKTYSVAVLSGSYAYTGTGGDQVTISALTAGGLFSSSTFGGVNVSSWQSVQPVNGTIFQFAMSRAVFDALGGGVDTDVDAEITAVVPLPATANMGIALIACVGGAGIWQRRKSGQVALI